MEQNIGDSTSLLLGWLTIDAVHRAKAKALAEQGDTEGLQLYLLKAIASAANGSMAVLIRSVMRPAVFVRTVDWDTVQTWLRQS